MQDQDRTGQDALQTPADAPADVGPAGIAECGLCGQHHGSRPGDCSQLRDAVERRRHDDHDSRPAHDHAWQLDGRCSWPTCHELRTVELVQLPDVDPADVEPVELLNGDVIDHDEHDAVDQAQADERAGELDEPAPAWPTVVDVEQDERDDQLATDDELGSYAAMFAGYVREQRSWITASHAPLVFHLRKLCARLDSDPGASAALSSAYLQAFTRLDKMRPGAGQPAGGAGDLPGQRSIFDELDDD